MATLDEANLARAQHADELAKVGVHAVGVEKGEAFGRTGWVVVAYTQSPAEELPQLPDFLTTKEEGNAVEVPLLVQRAEPFEAQ
ncbi:hypothetical protein [Rhizobium leguminosarum]|uniref:hypothetical protein n=1 Tax=Rhizobium leguminosarum TaxID=384 RepID=UPI001C959886|nr:hypothetical protein [Rhizobium leguminosarum]MBY5827117.1 hypothetical protein [Rhizobium leguminosarum]